MTDHYFSGESGNRRAIVADDLLFDERTCLLPKTAGFSVWTWVRNRMAIDDQEAFSPYAYTQRGALDSAALAVLRAGQMAMTAARHGDAAALHAAYRIMRDAGVFMGAESEDHEEYWIVRWLRDGC